MTSDGSHYARFQRALRVGRLSMVRAAAAELPRIDLDDALSICLLISEQDVERFERAAVRWLARLSLEVPTVRIEDLRAGLLAFEALAENPLGARTALAELCTRHGLDRAARGLASA
jgi:aminoglycoside/choline kinase family phosphotransferase